MSYTLRTFAGCAALVAAAWIVTARADTPDLAAESYKKAADADLKFLQTRLGELAKKEAAGERLLDGQIKPALGVSLLLAAYADVLGDSALKGNSLKVAEAIQAKKFKDANDLAKKLAVKPGKGKPAALPKPTGFKSELMLAAVMSPTRGASVGGLNIDRDIKDMTKNNNPAKIDPVAVEILAVRSAVISAYCHDHPNDKAMTKADNQKKWEKLSTEAIDLSKQLTAEAAKGRGADEKKLKTLLGNLNGRCNDCHTIFRDDE